MFWRTVPTKSIIGACMSLLRRSIPTKYSVLLPGGGGCTDRPGSPRLPRPACINSLHVSIFFGSYFSFTSRPCPDHGECHLISGLVVPCLPHIVNCTACMSTQSRRHRHTHIKHKMRNPTRMAGCPHATQHADGGAAALEDNALPQRRNFSQTQRIHHVLKVCRIRVK